jgi:hypothetical protein
MSYLKSSNQLYPYIDIQESEDCKFFAFWGFSIVAIPDLISQEQLYTQSSYESALDKQLEVQRQWICQLHNDHLCALSLRIIKRSANTNQKLFLGVLGKVQANSELECQDAAKNYYNMVRDTFPDGYPIHPCDVDELTLLRFPFLPGKQLEVAEFQRGITEVRTVSIESFQAPAMIDTWVPASPHFQEIFRAVVAHPAPIGIAINLVSTFLTDDEANLAVHLANAYGEMANTSESKGFQVTNTTISHQSQKPRLSADQAFQSWAYLSRALTNPFEMTIGILSETPVPFSIVAALKAAIAPKSGGSSHSQLIGGSGEIVKAETEAQRQQGYAVWQNLTVDHLPYPRLEFRKLLRLPHLFAAEEVHCVFRLPIADRRGTWGLPSAPGVKNFRRLPSHNKSPAEIQIGELRLTRKHLTQHLLISGVPGSGKTNTSLVMLEQLWSTHRIPWLVLEPAKTEYRGLKTVSSLSEDLLVFTLGDERTAPFRFNPFEVPEGINLDSHIGALIDLFSVSMSMWGPLPNVLELMISEAYRRKGFTLLGNNDRLQPPQFSDLAALIPEIVSQLGYKKETTEEITAALSVRINRFCRGTLGKMLNTSKSVSFEMLMQRPVILEMSQITNTDDRAFIMGLIFNRCYQYWTVRRHEATGDLKHVLLIEEAHNLLSNTVEFTNQEQPNPKGKAVRNFANMLAEVRGFGQGIVIAEQNPATLVGDIMVNTNIKIAHRTVEAQNRQRLATSMLLTSQQEKSLACLEVGQMFCYVGGYPEPILTSPVNFKDAHHGFNPQLEDADIQTMFNLQFKTQQMHLYSPFPGCPVEVELASCLEQGQHLVNVFTRPDAYKESKTRLILQLLAAPFGEPVDELRFILGNLLVQQGANHLSPDMVRGTLESAISLLALEAVQRKGKVHGWLGAEIQEAHRILCKAILDPDFGEQEAWIKMCQIPEHLLQLGLPHPDYRQCKAPGVFRYEVSILLNSKQRYLEKMQSKVTNKIPFDPVTVLNEWIHESIPFLTRHLSVELQTSVCFCVLVQLTEGKPEHLQQLILN